MKFRKAAIAAAILSVVSAAGTAFAQDDIYKLDRVLVTGTRSLEGQDPRMVANTVITREDIARLQPRSLYDLLQGQTGSQIGNMGGQGKESSMFLRGTESDHVLFLIDGVRVGSVTAGKEAFQDLPLDLIERIEIVRGPYSSLYGSDAIGGVVQIFTKRESMGVRPSFSASVGSYGSRRVSAGVSGGDRSTQYNLAASRNVTDGWNACLGSATLFAGCYADEPDKDGYKNTSVTGSVSHAWTPSVKSSANAMWVRGNNEYDGTYSNRSDIKQTVLGTVTEWRLAPSALVKFNVGQSSDDSVSYLESAYVGTVSSKRLSAGVSGDITLSPTSNLVVGWDGLRDRIGGDTGFEVTQRYNRAVFGQYATRFAGEQDLQLNVRRDGNSQFGGKTTGSVLYAVRLPSGYRLRASAGTAFKAPSFNELYFPYYGNPLLRPETSTNLELGVNYAMPLGSWSVNAFRNRVSDLIAHDSSILPWGGPNNIDRAVISGLEADMSLRAADIRVGGNVTLLSPRQSGGVFDGNLLPRRAQRTARLDLDMPFGEGFSYGLSVLGSSHRYDDLANTVRLGGYGRFDLRSSLAVSRSWRVDFSVENVFDRSIQTAAWYPQAGRNYLLTLRYAQ